MADKKSGRVVALFWAVAVGAAGAAGKWLWDNGFAVVWNTLAGALAHLFQSTAVSNWQWYLLALISAHSAMYWAWRLIPAKTFSHSRFNHDSFFGARWRWMYDTSGHPCNFVPYCMACDGMLVYSEFVDDMGSMRTELHCEHCATTPVSESGGKQYVWSKAARNVDRLVRTGGWQQRPGMGQQAK